jgi:hypothetical protein
VKEHIEKQHFGLFQETTTVPGLGRGEESKEKKHEQTNM